MTSLIQPKTHRKVIVPWYDTAIAIVLSILGLMIVFAFGIVGMAVAQGNAQHKNFLGMPLCIVLMSGYVIFTMVVRLFTRRSRGSK